MGCRDEKTNFFQWHSSNNVKIATPAEFEYQIPCLTWNSELCYFFREIFGYPSFHFLSQNVRSIITCPWYFLSGANVRTSRCVSKDRDNVFDEVDTCNQEELEFGLKK